MTSLLFERQFPTPLSLKKKSLPIFGILMLWFESFSFDGKLEQANHTKRDRRKIASTRYLKGFHLWLNPGELN